MVTQKCYHKYFFPKLWISTSIKPILKELFINYTQNKVIQQPNDVIVKGNYIVYWY
jgi:hypothetical protein